MKNSDQKLKRNDSLKPSCNFERSRSSKIQRDCRTDLRRIQVLPELLCLFVRMGDSGTVILMRALSPIFVLALILGGTSQAQMGSAPQSKFAESNASVDASNFVRPNAVARLAPDVAL